MSSSTSQNTNTFKLWQCMSSNTRKNIFQERQICNIMLLEPVSSREIRSDAFWIVHDVRVVYHYHDGGLSLLFYTVESTVTSHHGSMVVFVVVCYWCFNCEGAIKRLVERGVVVTCTCSPSEQAASDANCADLKGLGAREAILLGCEIHFSWGTR